jgi:hypothetical protein
MKTAMQELYDYVQDNIDYGILEDIVLEKARELLEKEKKQIQKAFSDGQETPINHPTLPHYSRDEYYNDNFNQNK